MPLDINNNNHNNNNNNNNNTESVGEHRAVQLLVVGAMNSAQILPPSLVSGQLALNGILINVDRVLMPPRNVSHVFTTIVCYFY
jgi:hypothetical protein